MEVEVIFVLKKQYLIFSKRRLINRYSSIQRTLHSQFVFTGNMAINHGSLDVDVTEVFLYRPDVIAFFQHVRSEAVP